MGFAVTATHLVFAVSLLSAGGFAAATYWKISGDVEDARRAEARRAEEVAHTTVEIVGAPTHDAANSTLTFDVKNAGSTVLDISEFGYIIDGAWNSNIASGYPIVSGAAATDLLLPRETMTVRLTGVATSPTNIAAIAGNGVSAYWST